MPSGDAAGPRQDRARARALPAAAHPVPGLGVAPQPPVLVSAHKPLQRAPGRMLFVNVSSKGERNGDLNCPLKN